MPREMPTIRKLIIVVAISSVPYGLAARSYRLRAIAGHHQREAAREAAAALAGPGGAIPPAVSARVRWHEAMAAKYHRAADRPIIDYGPDPSEPK